MTWLEKVIEEFGMKDFPDLASPGRDEESWKIDTEYMKLRLLASIADSLKLLNDSNNRK